jgi:hypothetical protein
LKEIGLVREIIQLPGQDLLAIDTPSGEVLIPMVKQIIISVDIAAKLIVVNPPEGLLDVKIDIISIFPEYLKPLELSLLGKAQEKGLISIDIHDLRKHTTDPHHSVDDTPYGGGAGMVMSAEPWGLAIDEISDSEAV